MVISAREVPRGQDNILQIWRSKGHHVSRLGNALTDKKEFGPEIFSFAF